MARMIEVAGLGVKPGLEVGADVPDFAAFLRGRTPAPGASNLAVIAALREDYDALDPDDIVRRLALRETLAEKGVKVD